MANSENSETLFFALPAVSRKSLAGSYFEMAARSAGSQRVR